MAFQSRCISSVLLDKVCVLLAKLHASTELRGCHLLLIFYLFLVLTFSVWSVLWLQKRVFCYKFRGRAFQWRIIRLIHILLLIVKHQFYKRPLMFSLCILRIISLGFLFDLLKISMSNCKIIRLNMIGLCHQNAIFNNFSMLIILKNALYIWS